MHYRLEEDYTEIGVLGSGGYGVVFHVQRATDKQDYALKLIDVSSKSVQYCIFYCCYTTMHVHTL